MDLILIEAILNQFGFQETAGGEKCIGFIINAHPTVAVGYKSRHTAG
jgi:hypothetical protein